MHGNDKPGLLYLCHRIPFPPNKGDKIRSYHLLRYLSRHYRIFLGTFIDDQEDWQYTSQVRELCADCCFVRLDPVTARIKSLKGLLTNEALTLPYYYSEVLSGWVAEQLQQGKIQRAVIYSSAMAQYITEHGAEITQRVIDFVDIDSDKWRQYSTRKPWPLSWVYRREADKLLSYERQVAAMCNTSLFVSSAEADLFKKLAPEVSGSTDFYNNGVDTDYFSPDTELDNPYDDGRQALVFTGAMDYWPNVDAVCWFAEKIFPILKSTNHQLDFYIVGSKPAGAVLGLSKLPGVFVTGRVPDVRPYLKHALAAVAPMRVARGIQNKVLEAMAMAKTVVVSPQALEGISAEHNTEVLLASDENAWLDLINQVVNGQFQEMGHIARQKVMRDFSWEDNLPIVRECLEAGCDGGSTDTTYG